MSKFIKIIIAIDGHSSCGKSTFAKAIAKELGYLYIDSGAMYRTVTLACIRNNCIHGDFIELKQVISLLNKISITFRRSPLTQNNDTYLNDENVENAIRGIEVSNHVSPVSAIPEVREKMVEIQRKLGKNKGVVMDGRDISTVVFPYAELKIFLTATFEIRAKRRYDELIAKGLKVNLEEIRKNIETRDKIDQNRKISPLRKADDAILLDNSNMTPDEQMIWFREIFSKIIHQKN